MFNFTSHSLDFGQAVMKTRNLTKVVVLVFAPLVASRAAAMVFSTSGLNTSTSRAIPSSAFADPIACDLVSDLTKDCILRFGKKIPKYLHPVGGFSGEDVSSSNVPPRSAIKGPLPPVTPTHLFHTESVKTATDPTNLPELQFTTSGWPKVSLSKQDSPGHETFEQDSPKSYPQTLISGASVVTISGTSYGLSSFSTTAIITVGSSKDAVDASSDILALGSATTMYRETTSPVAQAIDVVIDSSTNLANSGSPIMGISALGPHSEPNLNAAKANGHRIATESTAIPTHQILRPDPATLTDDRSGLFDFLMEPIPVSVDDIAFSVSPFEAIISESTFAISRSTNIVIGSRTLTILPPTVAKPTLSLVTVGDFTFSNNPSKAAISNTTHSIGSGASTQKMVAGNETTSLNSGDVALPSTTALTHSGSTSVSEPFTNSVSRLEGRGSVWIGSVLIAVMMLLAL